MYKTKLALLAVFAAAQMGPTVPANAEGALRDDFRFSYDPALLQSEEGRTAVDRSLQLQATQYCRRGEPGARAARYEQRCRIEVTSDAARQIAARHPDTGQWLVAKADTRARRSSSRTARS